MAQIKTGRPPFTPRVPQIPQQDIMQLVESRINNGMITTIDPADIPNGALQLALNANVRFDKTSRRLGTLLLQPLKPNNLPVIRIAFIKKQDGSPFTVRMTPTTIHTRSTSSWTAIAIASPLLGGTNDRFTTADILDKFVFANNGLNPIQTVDFNAGTCSDLGDPALTRYRYVVGFYNRAVGLALKDVSESQMGWSADGDATIWDPAINQTAGFAKILESPSDFSDFITGGLSFSNVMVIFREKSIWLATKQPIPTDPFYLYSAVPGIGNDCPFSIQLIQGGVAWTDIRTRCVYAYSPGNGQPEILSDANQKQIFDDLIDPAQVFSAYNKNTAEYSIYIKRDDETTRSWMYNFKTKAWTVNEYYGVTTAENVELASALTTIDELVGTIDDLSGTIDSLSKPTSIAVPFSFGRTDGSIAFEDPASETDAPHDDIGHSINYTTQLISKQFTLPENSLNLAKLIIEYISSRTTTLVLDISRDNGITWSTLKIFTINKLNKRTVLIWRKLVRCRQFAWRLSFTSSDLSILSYEVYVESAGDKNQNDS